jgi:hypothetical protein
MLPDRKTFVLSALWASLGTPERIVWFSKEMWCTRRWTSATPKEHGMAATILSKSSRSMYIFASRYTDVNLWISNHNHMPVIPHLSCTITQPHTVHTLWANQSNAGFEAQLLSLSVGISKVLNMVKTILKRIKLALQLGILWWYVVVIDEYAIHKIDTRVQLLSGALLTWTTVLILERGSKGDHRQDNPI